MTESGMSYFVGLASKSAGSAPGADEGQREVADDLAARRHLDDVAEDAGWPRRTCPRCPRSGRRGRGRWPAGAGWTAGRRGSRGSRPGRWGRAAPTRTGSRAAGRASQYGSSAKTVVDVEAGGALRCRRWRRRGPTGSAGSVVPAIAEHATSTASTPASMAASSVPIWPPAVSWVCRCTGQVEPLAQGGDQRAGRRGAQQPGHVLDGEDVGARCSTICSASRR